MDKFLFMKKMASAGYTQRSYAEKAGISKNTLNAKINGKSKIDTMFIAQACDLLHIVDPVEKVEIFLK